MHVILDTKAYFSCKTIAKPKICTITVFLFFFMNLNINSRSIKDMRFVEKNEEITILLAKLAAFSAVYKGAIFIRFAFSHVGTPLCPEHLKLNLVCYSFYETKFLKGSFDNMPTGHLILFLLFFFFI